MLNLNPSGKKYLSHVKRELRPHSFAFKEKALRTLAEDLLRFQEDAPQGGYEQICKQFGHPDKFADNLLETIEPDELKKSARRKKATTLMIIACLIIASVSIIAILFFALDHNVLHTVETTIVYVENEK